MLGTLKRRRAASQAQSLESGRSKYTRVLRVPQSAGWVSTGAVGSFPGFPPDYRAPCTFSLSALIFCTFHTLLSCSVPLPCCQRSFPFTLIFPRSMWNCALSSKTRPECRPTRWDFVHARFVLTGLSLYPPAGFPTCFFSVPCR